MDGAAGTIEAASAAFHTGVSIFNLHATVMAFENFMGTNLQAHSATIALPLIQPEGGHILKIDKLFHFATSQTTKSEQNQKIMPAKAVNASAGTAQRISFFTPEREV